MTLDKVKLVYLADSIRVRFESLLKSAQPNTCAHKLHPMIEIIVAHIGFSSLILSCVF